MTETHSSTLADAAQLRRAMRRYVFANALLLSCLITFARVFQQWWQDGTLVLDAHIAFTFVFWFIGGGFIGYFSWRKKRGQAEQIQQAEKE